MWSSDDDDCCSLAHSLCCCDDFRLCALYLSVRWLCVRSAGRYRYVYETGFSALNASHTTATELWAKKMYFAFAQNATISFFYLLLCCFRVEFYGALSRKSCKIFIFDCFHLITFVLCLFFFLLSLFLFTQRHIWQFYAILADLSFFDSLFAR